MKLFITLFLSLLITLPVFAGSSFKILSTDTDENGNIRVWTAHFVDGVNTESRYPKMKDAQGNDVYVYCTRYSKSNLRDKATTKEKEDYILADIQNHSKVLIQKEFDKKAPKSMNQIRIDYNRAENEKFIAAELKGLVGKGITTEEVVENIDTDLDGVNDKELKLKTDGSKVEKDI